MGFKRVTTMAEAFVNATVKEIKAGKADPQKGTGNWIARRVAVSATTRPGFCVVNEVDHRPTRKPAKLDDYVVAAMSEGFYEVMLAQQRGE